MDNGINAQMDRQMDESGNGQIERGMDGWANVWN